jgi:AbrB family looped-hinge helix DNA binding protein
LFTVFKNERKTKSCHCFGLLSFSAPESDRIIRFHFEMGNGIVNGMKNETIQIDKAGRVVLPKPLRQQFNLLPGDKLRLSVEGNGFRLEPAGTGGELVRKGSVLVFTGDFAESITSAKVNELIEQDREGRITAETGKLRKK